MQLSRGWSRRAAAGVIVLGLGALAAGCTPTASMPTPSASSPGYVSTYQTPAPTELAPLTGEEVEAGSLTGPSLAAKIDNHPDARPQFGLNHTDLVYEELVEGGLTRYAAVWYSDLPKEIGPIRSIRPMDPDIVAPLGGMIAYSGGQYRFVVLMQSTDVYNAIHGQRDTEAVMFRTTKRIAPHNVIVKARELKAMHSKIAPPPQQFSFAPELATSSAVREGKPFTKMDLRFSPASLRTWKYDAAAQKYLRSQDGASDKDEKGDRISATNVVVLRVPVSFGFGIPKTELVGSGEAVISSGGYTIKGKWSKGSRTSPVRIVDENGTVIRLAPGNSWIELVPTSGSTKFTP